MSYKKIAAVGLLAASFGMSGCAAVAVGAYAYNNSEKREARQKFIEDYNKTNIEREKAGLKPIELCEAKRSFDPEWAEEDKVCNKN
jgi:hypothetical protein